MEWATACLGRARPRGPEPEGLCHSNSRVECAPLRRTLDNEESFYQGSRSVKTHAATILTLTGTNAQTRMTEASLGERRRKFMMLLGRAIAFGQTREEQNAVAAGDILTARELHSRRMGAVAPRVVCSAGLHRAGLQVCRSVKSPTEARLPFIRTSRAGTRGRLFARGTPRPRHVRSAHPRAPTGAARERSHGRWVAHSTTRRLRGATRGGGA